MAGVDRMSVSTRDSPMGEAVVGSYESAGGTGMSVLELACLMSAILD